MLLTRQQLIVELVQEHPELIGILFSWARVDGGKLFVVRVDAGSEFFVRYSGVETRTPDLTACGAAASTAPEHVFALQNSHGDIELLVILVVQMEVSHDSKLDWPRCVWNLRASQACTDVCLLVIAADEAVAEWAEKALDSGPHRFAPIVLNPGRVPALKFEGENIPENPAACVLAALLHALDTDSPAQCAHRVKVAGEALQKMNLTHALDCRDLLLEPLLTTLARVLEPMVDEYATTRAARPEQHDGGDRERTSTVEGLRAFLSERTVDDRLAQKLFAQWELRQGMLELLLRQLRQHLPGAFPASVEQRVWAATNGELFAIGSALVTEAPLRALDRLRDRSLDQAQMRALRQAWDELVQRRDSFDGDVVRAQLESLVLRAHSASLLVAKQLHLRFGAPEAEMTERLKCSNLYHIYQIGERLLTEKSLEEALKYEY